MKQKMKEKKKLYYTLSLSLICGLGEIKKTKTMAKQFKHMQTVTLWFFVVVVVVLSSRSRDLLNYRVFIIKSIFCLFVCLSSCSSLNENVWRVFDLDLKKNIEGCLFLLLLVWLIAVEKWWNLFFFVEVYLFNFDKVR